jgi:hypothetical protein
VLFRAMNYSDEERARRHKDLKRKVDYWYEKATK